MGCCCSDPGIPGKPNDVPDPPPLCRIPIYVAGLYRSVGSAPAFRLQQDTIADDDSAVVNANIASSNDRAWSKFTEDTWGPFRGRGS